MAINICVLHSVSGVVGCDQCLQEAATLTRDSEVN